MASSALSRALVLSSLCSLSCLASLPSLFSRSLSPLFSLLSLFYLSSISLLSLFYLSSPSLSLALSPRLHGLDARICVNLQHST